MRNAEYGGHIPHSALPIPHSAFLHIVCLNCQVCHRFDLAARCAAGAFDPLQPLLELAQRKVGERALFQTKGHLRIRAEGVTDDPKCGRQQLVHRVLAHLPEAGIRRHQPGNEIHTVGNVARLVLFQERNALTLSGQDPVAVSTVK